MFSHVHIDFKVFNHIKMKWINHLWWYMCSVSPNSPLSLIRLCKVNLRHEPVTDRLVLQISKGMVKLEAQHDGWCRVKLNSRLDIRFDRDIPKDEMEWVLNNLDLPEIYLIGHDQSAQARKWYYASLKYALAVSVGFGLCLTMLSRIRVVSHNARIWSHEIEGFNACDTDYCYILFHKLFWKFVCYCTSAFGRVLATIYQWDVQVA